MRRTLVESPTGLIHLAMLLPSGRAVTQCGREINKDTWVRIRRYDEEIAGKTKSSIRGMIDSSLVCDRCL